MNRGMGSGGLPMPGINVYGTPSLSAMSGMNLSGGGLGPHPQSTVPDTTCTATTKPRLPLLLRLVLLRLRLIHLPVSHHGCFERFLL